MICEGSGGILFDGHGSHGSPGKNWHCSGAISGRAALKMAGEKSASDYPRLVSNVRIVNRDITQNFGTEPLYNFCEQEHAMTTVVGTNSNWKDEVEKSGVPVVVTLGTMVRALPHGLTRDPKSCRTSIMGELKVVKVNVDENQELAMKFGIMSIPTIMLFRNGKDLDKAIGAAPSEYYESMLSKNHVIVNDYYYGQEENERQYPV